MSNKVLRKLDYWQSILGLSEYRVIVSRVSPLQITHHDEKTGGDFIGVVLDEKSREIWIITTRSLQEEDIVHELLHIREPKMDHGEVVLETESLIFSRNQMHLESLSLQKER